MMFFLFLFEGHLFCQIAYYDALALSKWNKDSSMVVLDKGVDSVFLILRNYVPDTLKFDKNRIMEYFNKPGLGAVDPNPFIEISGSQHGRSEKRLPGTFSGITPELNRFNFTNIAEGLATFLLKRSKEELNVAFFNRFTEYIRSYPATGVLFPKTSSTLKTLYSYQYSQMLPILRGAFQKDFNSLLANSLNLRDSSKYDGYSENSRIKDRADKIIKIFDSSPGRALAGALIIADGLSIGINPADIISNLADDKICTDFPDDYLSNVIRFSDLFSKSLRSNSNDIWVNGSDLEDLVNNRTAFRIYLGLLYSSDKKSKNPIRFTIGTSKFSFQQLLETINDKLGTNADPIKTFRFLESFANLTRAMSQYDRSFGMIKIQTFKNEEINTQDQPYFTAVTDFIINSIRFITENIDINLKEPGLTQEVLKYISVAEDARLCVYDLRDKDYTALILNSYSLLSEVLSPDSAWNKEYIKYGIFMANVLCAQNADEVSAALEAAALPVGSSSIKRETNFSISLNSFIGPHVGGEYLPRLESQKWGFVTGITAPVGVAFSWGNLGHRRNHDQGKIGVNGKICGGKSISLFIPVVDVGSLATFRIANDSSKVASEIKLANIISPGLYLYYGFGKCPVSIGIGGQLGPQLRSVTASEINIDKNYYLKFGFDIVIDIPIFNFYVKN